MEPYIAEIRMFAGNFAPRGWALCNGQVMSIAQNTALFSLVGTIYGGDGRTTFALPNLQGRMATHLSDHYWLGMEGDGAEVAAGNSGYVGVNYIIALQGIYPPRS